MSQGYGAISWNPQKRAYDFVLLGGIALYLGAFLALGSFLHPTATAETLLIRAFGSCAYLLLNVTLCIGPICRLDPRFLPLLYNRRHLGVATFLLGLAHGGFALFQFHALGDADPLLSLLTSNRNFTSLADFPFELLGFLALLILFLMAATSHDFWLRNLTPRIWKSLHMLVYLAYAVLVSHITLGLLQSERSPLLAGALGVSVFTVISLHLAAALREKEKDEVSRQAQGTFVAICPVTAIPEKRAKVISVRGERVAVFKYDGKVAALSNVCRHQNGPLGEGKIIDGCVTCPWHGYQYAPESGRAPAPFTEKVSTFRTKLAEGFLWLDPEPLPPGTAVEPSRIVPADEGRKDEFYIGYLASAPPGIRRQVRVAVAGVVFLAIAGAVLFAASQRNFANSYFDYGKPAEFAGTVTLKPFPTLIVSTPSATTNATELPFLLVAPGKHGADPLLAGYDGKQVRLRGTLIHRAEGQMIEVEPQSISASERNARTQGTEEDWGEANLRGEIVDTKCYLGVMNPGQGKVHRECAARCLSGGIPPALLTSDLDGSARLLLLTNETGQPLPKEAYLARVGQPVTIRGRIIVFGGFSYLRTSAASIVPLS